MPELLLVAFLIAASSQTVDTGTLIPVGVSKNAITIGADSAVYNRGQTIQIMTQKKIVPVGKFGACAFLGSAGIRELINGKVVDETRLRPIAEKWLKKHPVANIRNAYASIDSDVIAAMKEFLHRHPELAGNTIRPESTKRSFASLLCVGYDMGVPVGFVSDYIAPHVVGGEFVRDPQEFPLMPGFFGPFGQDSACLELTRGASTQLTRFKDSTAVSKYRTARAANKTSDLSTDDLLALSKVCLEATESPESKALEPQPYGVAPPNHYAVIDQKQGFHWVN